MSYDTKLGTFVIGKKFKKKLWVHIGSGVDLGCGFYELHMYIQCM
jgi:hypothetical protein